MLYRDWNIISDAQRSSCAAVQASRRSDKDLASSEPDPSPSTGMAGLAQMMPRR